MSLNIKDPEVYQLAKALAKATGETMTLAVKKALLERQERLDKRKGKASFEEMMAIADSCAALVKRPYLDHAELLYDEHGLPK